VYTRSGWKRPKRSKLFKHRTRINARKGRRHARRVSRYSFRRNPALPFAIDKVAIGGLKVAAGLIAGNLGTGLIAKFMPADVTAKYGKFYGAIHVAAGAAGAAFIKNKMAKDVMLLVAATGIYDLIASNVPMLKLPILSRTVPFMAGEDEPGVIGMGASYQQIGADDEPALGASYQQVGVDDISYGGDSIELD